MMAVAVIGNLFAVCSPRQLCRSKQSSLKHSSCLSRRAFATNVDGASSSTAFVEANRTEPIVVEKEGGRGQRSNLLACPICYESLSWNADPALSVDSIRGSSLQCTTCKKTYIGNQTHLDLTTSSGAKSYGEFMPPSTEFFRLRNSLPTAFEGSLGLCPPTMIEGLVPGIPKDFRVNWSPLISFLYERGWRQTFSVLGDFPGPEKEFELMKDFLKPVLGGNIIDASCASGLFSRLFVKSGLFSSVVALDYSENMLQQCYEFIKQEENFPKENLILVRGDIARLPFLSSSVDAVHAGAALQCWPSPSAAVAEISRVLRPGGVFVATTFILDGPFAVVPFLSTIRQNIRQASGSFIFLSERELEDLCRACGLVGFSCIRNGFFVMISATKPS